LVLPKRSKRRALGTYACASSATVRSGRASSGARGRLVRCPARRLRGDRGAHGRRQDDAPGPQRRQFANVLQEPVLLSTSISENIAYGRPGANEAQIIAAAAAGAHKFISRLPRGYETLVGERGMLLSGGERQRIALARAF
jgi:ABC-type nitrate/sulfonate/bicarbonate transport system ATPase subunit